MKRTNVYLDEEQDRLLRDLSAQEGRPLTEIVREALGEYLERRGIRSSSRAAGPQRSIPDDEWGDRFQAVLKRIREGMRPGTSAEEIEAEITTAWEEVRRENTARRRAANG